MKREKLKPVTKIIKIVVQSAILFILPFVVFTLLTSNTDILAHIRSFTVVTGSMEPKIAVGSIVYTMPQSVYKVGDVITFHRDNITVTHRIVSITTKNKVVMFQTKGDANNVADLPLVPSNRVIGKDIVIVPFIGRFAAFLKTIPGFILFVLIPTLYVIATEVWIIKKEIEQGIEKKVLTKLHIE